MLALIILLVCVACIVHADDCMTTLFTQCQERVNLRKSLTCEPMLLQPNSQAAYAMCLCNHAAESVACYGMCPDTGDASGKNVQEASRVALCDAARKAQMMTSSTSSSSTSSKSTTSASKTTTTSSAGTSSTASTATATATAGGNSTATSAGANQTGSATTSTRTVGPNRIVLGQSWALRIERNSWILGVVLSTVLLYMILIS